jgi:glycosyltransferase involved in cell wall biosynthesis
MDEHGKRMGPGLQEFCLQTADPVTAGVQVIPYTPRAPSFRPSLRPLPRHLDLIALVLAWRRLAEAVNRSGCEVVLAHPCQYLQAPLALCWLEAPSVYFCHEPRRVDYEAAASARVNPRTRHVYGALHRAERALDRTAVRRAGRLLTNSHFTAGRIERAYGRVARPVPLGVPDAFRARGPEREPSHLLSVGTLIPSKGHDLAIAAAALAARRRPLVIVAPSLRADEAARLRALAVERSVELEIRIGVSDEELRDLYRGALATLYLAREEPLGLVSLEAQACGSPVIVADEGGLPETMIPGETGWAVSRSDAAAAAGAIDRLEDPAVRREFSTRAAQHGGAQTWERSTEHIWAALAEAGGS